MPCMKSTDFTSKTTLSPAFAVITLGVKRKRRAVISMIRGVSAACAIRRPVNAVEFVFAARQRTEEIDRLDEALTDLRAQLSAIQ